MNAAAQLGNQTSAPRSGEELDLEKLEGFLRTHFAGPTGYISVRQFRSGHSNLTYLVRLSDREFVLRRPPFGSKVKTAHDMGREFRVLSKLHDVYPPAPQVLLYCEDESVLGAPFYLMEPISGVIIRSTVPAGVDFSPAIAKKVSESFIDNLARLHSVDYAAAGLGDLGKPQGYLERQVRGWIERYHAAKTQDFPGIEKIISWMQQHLPADSGATLIHNDYKYDNVVLDAGDITKIAGVLDWEMCTIGDPLSDLGTALAYWIEPGDPEDLRAIRWAPTDAPGTLSRAELAQRYAEKTGRAVSHISFYLAFAYFKIAVIVQQIYFRYQQGLTKDERFAAMPTLVETLLRASLRTVESHTQA
jgi:aminoglycoside phosphotransferase (APT) family kinase protein